jgi:hypothetical protein
MSDDGWSNVDHELCVLRDRLQRAQLEIAIGRAVIVVGSVLGIGAGLAWDVGGSWAGLSVTSRVLRLTIPAFSLMIAFLAAQRMEQRFKCEPSEALLVWLGAAGALTALGVQMFASV